MDPVRLRAAYEQAKGELLAERTADGHWVGELSSSALSTATAVSALAVALASGRREPPDRYALPFAPDFVEGLITRGVRYLLTQQNADGGFGDTDLSHSNIATTYLVVAALHLAGKADAHAGVLARANAYIEKKGGLAGLRERYGIDKTFVVPIMTNCALAGLIDWGEIDSLPFELACVPQSLYRFVGMPVVSYAIPALVAIGQARYHHAPPRNPITRLVRWLSITRSLKVLRRMQPDSGGYLEATPLTSFVVMSLASCPHVPIANEVIREGVKFLANSIRPNGSWPIDTNLATWNTTLAINALAGAGEDVAELVSPKCLDWLLSCQHTKRHPFTGADPGGFGWSDLAGAVPDVDDTAGALLAIDAWRGHREFQVREYDSPMRVCAVWGVRWLFGLQNRDGGWPTFCRGWGKLPFDRSGADLTAHALRALKDWIDVIGPKDDANRITMYKLTAQSKHIIVLPWEQRQGANGGLRYLSRHQRADGSWSPLWFGNQDHPQEDNPVYGTAKVLFAYRDLGLMDSSEARRGVAWLVANQNADGGWGSGVWRRVRGAECGVLTKPHGAGGVESGQGVTGSDQGGHSNVGTEYSVPSTQYSAPDQSTPLPSPEPRAPSPLISSVEETALAVEALLAACPRNATEGVPYSAPEPRTLNPDLVTAAVEKGLTWLIERVECGEHCQPAPIGFYFAKLWYYERLYPLIFTVAALGRACRQFAHPASTGTTPWTTAAP